MDAIKQMWIGVGIAVALCFGIAVLLEVVGEQLPQREQEGLETVIGLIAVSAVTYMIVWMRRNARGIKEALEGNAAHALARGSAMALVAMAFLAVLREGFETSVFLLAAFQDADRHDRGRRRRGDRPDRGDRDRRSASIAAACASTSTASSASPA